MTTNRIFTGHDQAANAALTTSSGVFYRCYVWLNRSIPDGAGSAVTAIESACYTEQEHGQAIEVWRNTIELAEDEDHDLDSPKIIAVGSTFIVHWIRRTGTTMAGLATFELARASQDMDAFDIIDWTAHGATTLHEHALYDARRLVGSETDFLVARYSAANTITVQRFDGLEWADLAWTNTLAADIEASILGVYGHLDDNFVVISYEILGALWSARFNASNGGGVASAQTFDEPFVSLPESRWVQITHARTAFRVVGLAVEFVPLDQIGGDILNGDVVHWVAYGRISTVDCSNSGDYRSVPNVTLASHCWTYENGTTVDGGPVDFYAMLAFKSVEDPYNWSQSYAWACNFDMALWNDGGGVRPRPIANINSVGVPDGRIAATTPATNQEIYGGGFVAISYPQRRMNHLSEASVAPQFGPHIKSRTVAAIAFARLESVRTTQSGLGDDPLELTELVPAGAGVVGYRIYMEDPWLSPRDASEPERADDNFSMAYPLAMHQSVEAGRSLVIAGGCPSTYDGSQIVEVGYPWRPEAISIEVFNGADQGYDEFLEIGWYQVYFVYKWTDNQGQVHRSGPSSIYTFYANVNFPIVTYYVRTQSLSLRGPSKHSPHSHPIEIEVYRTPFFALDTMIADGDVQPGAQPLGGLFYRVFGSGDPTSDYRPVDTPVNNPAAIAVTIMDGLDSANLIAHGLGPYQVSETGIVPTPPQQPPAMSVITRWRNRVWMSTGEDEASIWYSREIGLDYGSDFYRAVEFNDTNSFRIDGIDEITGLVGMNTGLVVFTRASISWITGDNLDGTLAMRLQLEVLHTGTGCIEPRSIAFGPPGVFFQAAKGYYLLTRDRDLDYISAGAAVEEMIRAAGNIRSATILEDRNQLRLVCNGRDVITQTVGWEFIGIGDPGTWTITFVEAGIAVEWEQTIDIADTTEIRDALAAVINALVPTTLAGLVALATSDGGFLYIELAEGVHDQTVSIDPPTGAVVLPLDDTVTRESRPQVLLFDYLHRMWASIPMVGVSTNEAQNLAVAGCSWRGLDGEIAHVVLHQGGLHVERGTRDPAPYTDSTSTGDVGIPIDILTSWIQLAGIAGCKRVRRMIVQGVRLNAARWWADVEFDDDGTFDGDDPPPDLAIEFDDDAAAGEIRPSIQQVGALRVRIYEDSGVINEQTISLTALVIEAGIKRGARRGADALIGV